MTDILDRLGWVRSSTGFDLEKIEWRQKVQCLTREIERRRRAYPQVVAKGQATQLEVDQELAAMEAILSDYWDGLFRFRIKGWDDEQARRRRCLEDGLDPLSFTEPQEKSA